LLTNLSPQNKLSHTDTHIIHLARSHGSHKWALNCHFLKKITKFHQDIFNLGFIFYASQCRLSSTIVFTTVNIYWIFDQFVVQQRSAGTTTRRVTGLWRTTCATELERNMAASVRALRFFSDSTRNIHHVSRCRIKHVCCRARITGCRGYSDSTEGRNTHFGFQTIPEEEKAQKGELHTSVY